MVKLIIIRHGYSLFNKEKRFSGQYDVALDSVGLSQAQDTANFILENYKIDKIYSSDLIRALQTAMPIAAALNLPINKTSDLREWNVGEWQGKRIEDVKKEYPETFTLYKTDVGISHPDGGESFSEFQQRCVCAIENIVAENDGKTVLVSTHGGVVRALRCAWSGLKLGQVKDIPHVPNASICVAEYENGQGNFTQIGLFSHLKDQTTEFSVQ